MRIEKSNQFWLKSIMAATYDYNRAVFNANRNEKKNALKRLLNCIDEKEDICPTWFLNQRESYKKQLIAELYAVYTNKEDQSFEGEIERIEAFITCKQVVDSLNGDLPDWQKDISKNNYLRAGAKSRELAIVHGRLDVIREVKALLLSKEAYEKFEGELADWQSDMLSIDVSCAKKLRQRFKAYSNNRMYSSALYCLVLANCISRKLEFDSDKLYLSESIPMTSIERLLVTYDIYLSFLPNSYADYILLQYQIENCVYIHSEEIERLISSKIESEKDLFYIYILYERLNKQDSHSKDKVLEFLLNSIMVGLENELLTYSGFMLVKWLTEKLLSIPDNFLENYRVNFIGYERIVERILLNENNIQGSILFEFISFFENRDLDYFISESQTKLKLRNRDFKLSKTPPVIVRPHLLGGKNTLFDVQYIHNCIESILLNLDESGTVIFVVNDKEQFKDIDDERLFVFQFEEFSNDDYFNFIANYEHLSTNPIGFEMFAISSYFYKRAVTDYIGADDVFIVEGDVLILRNIEEFYEANGEAYLSDGNACCVARLPTTLLRHYCTVVNMYYTELPYLNELKDIFNARMTKGLNGGICDMTFWDFIATDKHGLNNGFLWKKAEELVNDAYCDTHFRVMDDIVIDGTLVKSFEPYEYQLDSSAYKSLIAKKFKLVEKDESLYFSYEGEGNDIIVNSAHFVGGYKQVMALIWPDLRNKLLSAK